VSGACDIADFFIGIIDDPANFCPEFKCATCSGALSETSRLAIKFTVGMAVIYGWGVYIPNT
jgi:hypothetical protein